MFIIFVHLSLRDWVVLPESSHVVYSARSSAELNEDVLEEFSPVLFQSNENKQDNFYHIRQRS